MAVIDRPASVVSLVAGDVVAVVDVAAVVVAARETARRAAHRLTEVPRAAESVITPSRRLEERCMGIVVARKLLTGTIINPVKVAGMSIMRMRAMSIIQMLIIRPAAVSRVRSRDRRRRNAGRLIRVSMRRVSRGNLGKHVSRVRPVNRARRANLGRPGSHVSRGKIVSYVSVRNRVRFVNPGKLARRVSCASLGKRVNCGSHVSSSCGLRSASRRRRVSHKRVRVHRIASHSRARARSLASRQVRARGRSRRLQSTQGKGPPLLLVKRRGRLSRLWSGPRCRRAIDTTSK